MEIHFNIFGQPQGFDIVYHSKESTGLHCPDPKKLHVYVEKSALDELQAKYDELEKAVKESHPGNFNGFVKDQETIKKLKAHAEAMCRSIDAIDSYYNDDSVESYRKDFPEEGK